MQSLKPNLSQIEKELVDIFKVDLTDELAQSFVSGLLEEIDASSAKTLEDIAQKGSVIFENLAENVYGPLMVAYTAWILDAAKSILGNNSIFFAARDATPLFYIASELATRLGIETSKLKKLYYTRKIAGQADEIAGFGQRNVNEQMLKDYLAQQGVTDKSLIADMGLYGSLYKLACKKGLWEGKPNLVLFYSKNPNITGFLNTKVQTTQEMAQLGNLIVDCGECANPHKIWSPGQLVKMYEIVKPNLELIDNYFMQEWADAALNGYKKAAQNYSDGQNVNLKTEMNKIQKLSDDAKQGKFTGVLPYCTPEWSQKAEFLAAWDIGPVPPNGTKHGNYASAQAQ